MTRRIRERKDNREFKTVRTTMWFFYEILLLCGLLLYLPRAVWRRRLPHRGWGMRLGRYPDTVRQRLRQPGSIWIHAVSVGEVMTTHPLIRRLTADDPTVPLVLSTITPTGFEVASRVVGDRGVAIFGPLDFGGVVTRALRVIRPRILLLMESELWPNLIRLTKRHGIPVVVVNGRVSERAYHRYLWVKPWLAGLLESVNLFLMQTEADATRVIRMGAPRSRVRVLGSLKWDASLASRPRSAELDALASRLGLRADEALIVAGSTHRGEEAVLLDAFQAVRKAVPQARLMIAPRHLERVGEVEDLVRQRGISVQRMTRLLDTTQPWEVAIVDTLGQLPSYYGLATVVFVGGSLIPHGGQNPLEPASLGKPVMFGPSMNNFAEITRQLLAHRAAWQLQNGAELTGTLHQLLTDGFTAQTMGRRAQELAEDSVGCTQRTLDALTPLLTHLSPTA